MSEASKAGRKPLDQGLIHQQRQTNTHTSQSADASSAVHTTCSLGSVYATPASCSLHGPSATTIGVGYNRLPRSPVRYPHLRYVRNESRSAGTSTAASPDSDTALTKHLGRAPFTLAAPDRDTALTKRLTRGPCTQTCGMCWVYRASAARKKIE
jgi:hypothetical protein